MYVAEKISGFIRPVKEGSFRFEKNVFNFPPKHNYLIYKLII